jgi:hypothetical protein
MTKSTNLCRMKDQEQVKCDILATDRRNPDRRLLQSGSLRVDVSDISRFK